MLRRFGSSTASLGLAKRCFSRSAPLLVRGSGQKSSESSSGGWVMPNFSPSTTGTQSQTAGEAALTPHVRKHMLRVYNLLALGVGSAGVGSAAMMLTPLGKMIPYWVPMVGGFVPLLWLMFKPPASVQARLALFFAFTTLEGMTLAPLIKATMLKGVLGSALVLTAAIFVGFSAAALAAPRASMLALQGPLFGMLIGMVAISVLNIFYPTAFAHSIVLYGGLAIFSLFVAVDTQAMIERASCGANDHVGDALQMFLNVVNIFVRIAAILRGE
jgi:FtsH-binding integral membrane protein